jgi:hypothetical protein
MIGRGRQAGDKDSISYAVLPVASGLKAFKKVCHVSNETLNNVLCCTFLLI